MQPDPYVADPAEPAPRPALWQLRPLLTVLVVLLMAAAAAYLVYDAQARQDPALDVPADQPEA